MQYLLKKNNLTYYVYIVNCHGTKHLKQITTAGLRIGSESYFDFSILFLGKGDSQLRIHIDIFSQRLNRKSPAYFHTHEKLCESGWFIFTVFLQSCYQIFRNSNYQSQWDLQFGECCERKK